LLKPGMFGGIVWLALRTDEVMRHDHSSVGCEATT
jgi:hypothetical protein